MEDNFSEFDPSNRLIGIMMIRKENDILDETLKNLTITFDRIFVLDGTEPEDEFQAGKKIMEKYPEVELILRDKETPGPFPIRDGARHYLLQEVRKRYGVNNWIGILHGDELYTFDPRVVLGNVNPNETPVVSVRLCHFFLHRDDQEHWTEIKSLPLEQRVTHYMWPGTPEDRFFFDKGLVDYCPARHSLVVPFEHGSGRMTHDYLIVKQYNYRSPRQMYDRACQRIGSCWQSNHYEHIYKEKLFFVNGLHIPGYAPCGADNVRQMDPHLWSKPRSIKQYPLASLISSYVPIFIGSTGRSGSTISKEVLSAQDKLVALQWESKFLSWNNGLMELLYDFTIDGLNRFLKNMSNIGECSYPEYLCRELTNWRFRVTDGFQLNVERFDDELRHFADVISCGSLPFEVKKIATRRFVHFLFDRLAIAQRAVGWIEQTPRNINWASELLDCFPNSVFLYVYRDPRDVIASLIPLWWGPNDVAEGVEYYKERYRVWKKSMEKIEAKNQRDRVFSLCFEKLVGGDTNVLSQLMSHIGLEYQPVEIDKTKANIGRWYRDFNNADREYLCRCLHSELTELGYDLL